MVLKLGDNPLKRDDLYVFKWLVRQENYSVTQSWQSRSFMSDSTSPLQVFGPGVYILLKNYPPPLTWNDKRCAKLNFGVFFHRIRGEKNYISGKQIEKREKLPLSIQYFSPISKSYNFFLKLSTWAKRRLFSYLFLLNQSPQFSDWKMRLLFLFPNVFLKIFPFIF